MRAVKKSGEAIRADAMASNLLNNDYDSFWTDVKKLNSSNAIISNLIDGTSGESNITNLWKKHFCNILNANTCDSDCNCQSGLVTNIHILDSGIALVNKRRFNFLESNMFCFCDSTIRSCLVKEHRILMAKFMPKFFVAL